MIDIEKDDLLTIDQVVRLLPRSKRGKKKNKATVRRCINPGLKCGRKLEAIKLGREWVTSVKALQDFRERREPPTLKDPKVSDAEAKLKRLGF